MASRFTHLLNLACCSDTKLRSSRVGALSWRRIEGRAASLQSAPLDTRPGKTGATRGERGLGFCHHIMRASVVSIAVVATASGCASAPARFYTLDSMATAEAAPAARYAVLVGPVSVPASVDRPEFVVQVAPNRVDVDEFNRWAAPLNDGIARAVAGDLAVLLGTQDVAVAPLANFNPAYRVTINVQQFDSIQGEAVLVDAVWAVSPTASGETRSGRTVAREAVQDKSYEALAAAHSRALAKVSGDIAAAIRTASTASETSEIRNPKSETRNKSKTANPKKPNK